MKLLVHKGVLHLLPDHFAELDGLSFLYNVHIAPLSFSDSYIHRFRNRTNKFRREQLVSFLLPRGWGRARASLHSLPTCPRDSCSLRQRSSAECLCDDGAPNSSSSPGMLKKHCHHQGQVLLRSGKDTR